MLITARVRSVTHLDINIFCYARWRTDWGSIKINNGFSKTENLALL